MLKTYKGNEYVFRFDVPMNHIDAVKIKHCFQHLSNVFGCGLFVESLIELLIKFGNFQSFT